jgi:hypothetical protein
MHWLGNVFTSNGWSDTGDAEALGLWWPCVFVNERFRKQTLEGPQDDIFIETLYSLELDLCLERPDLMVDDPVSSLCIHRTQLLDSIFEAALCQSTIWHELLKFAQELVANLLFRQRGRVGCLTVALADKVAERRIFSPSLSVVESVSSAMQSCTCCVGPYARH